MTARVPRPLVAVLGLFVAIGAVTFALGVTGAEPERAWAAYLVNFVFFFSIAQAGIVFAAIQRIVGARWSGPVLRVAEGFGAFLPVALAAFMLLLVGTGRLYEWVHHPVPVKAAWLNLPFMVTRDLAVVVVLVGLSVLYLRLAVQPDLPGARPGPDELARRRRVLGRLSPVICLLYVIGMSVLAWDLLMSLDPHWYSTMFSVIVFWGGMLGTVAALAWVSVLLGRHLGVAPHLTPTTYHDLGKLVFAFSIFWAYINYAQLLVIWYGNLPEETNWMWLRVGGTWRPVAVAVGLACWLVPFVGLLSRAAKKHPPTLALFATVVLVGLWLERYLMVYPAVVRSEGGIPLGLTEVGVSLGFLGLFLLAFLWFLSRVPPVAVHDFLAIRERAGH
ncbi:MAG TPA: hypothetical protein VNM66_07635 [Thermodesulfobacteriota bacterium]|nr:hypothetical protein [Thermodesulfobacteriota bacterium]